MKYLPDFRFYTESQLKPKLVSTQTFEIVRNFVVPKRIFEIRSAYAVFERRISQSSTGENPVA